MYYIMQLLLSVALAFDGHCFISVENGYTSFSLKGTIVVICVFVAFHILWKKNRR